MTGSWDIQGWSEDRPSHGRIQGAPVIGAASYSMWMNRYRRVGEVGESIGRMSICGVHCIARIWDLPRGMMEVAENDPPGTGLRMKWPCRYPRPTHGTGT